MNVLIPMAGAGSRFASAGYAKPKPLIDVEGAPMIVRVIENLGDLGVYTFVVRDEFEWSSELRSVLEATKPDCKIRGISGITRGAAETCLDACKWADMSGGLVIANCDQIMNWDWRDFAQCIKEYPDDDGMIVTFDSDSLKNSYVRIDDDGWAVEVAEKVVISELATTGVYYWKDARQFVSCAESMITKGITTNGEFYVCPVYNELLLRGGKVSTYHVDKHWPIGTPEDLESYLNRWK